MFHHSHPHPATPLPAGSIGRPGRWRVILTELSRHVPFTLLGTASGILIMLVLVYGGIPRSVSQAGFWTLHPLHVLLSSLVTTAMFRLHGGRGWWKILLIGYLGSVGIATVSDSLIPFAGEWLLDLPHRGVHLGFIEKWWLVNPLALLGIILGVAWPHTRFSHAGHVFLSTWASLFHITMAMGTTPSPAVLAMIAAFLFVAVWLPCCVSDIVFPLLFLPARTDRPAPASSSTGKISAPAGSHLPHIPPIR